MDVLNLGVHQSVFFLYLNKKIRWRKQHMEV